MPGGFTIGDTRLSQRWQSWKFCARSTEKGVRMALKNARYALSRNQSGIYAKRLKAMIETYEECLGG